jgi:hypothetical protein
MAKNTTQRQLYDFLVGRGFDPTETNSVANDVIDPSEGNILQFHYIAPSGENYGTVVILLGDNKEMSVFFGDEKGKTMNPDDRDSWFDFLQDLKPWAVMRDRDFSVYNMAQLKHHITSMRMAMNESLFESMMGNATRSWTAKPDQVRMVIHHSKKLNETDKRYRNIDKIFIETADGERFRLPFRSLAGGKAMLEHVRHGGTPYDLKGVHIAEMVQELAVLSRFRRAHQNKIFEGEAQSLIEQANEYYQNLHRSLKHLASPRGYNNYFESWEPSKVDDADMMVEDLRTMFVEQSVDQRIETALPVLAKLQQRRNQMREFNEFAEWTELVTEGTWAVPRTPQEFQQLNNLLSKPLIVGYDALDVTEQLNDLFGDDDLNDELEILAMQNPDADARPIILNRLKELGIELPPAPAQQPQVQAEPEPELAMAEMLEFPKVAEDDDDVEVTDPKEIGAKINPAMVTPMAKAAQKKTPDAPAPAKVTATTTPLPDYKFEDIERIKSLVSYLNR